MPEYQFDVWQRRTAGGVPEQRPEQGTGQGLGRASSSKLRRRLLSEGSAISRSYTHFGAPRRATAPHGIGTWSSYMTLSELVRNSLTGCLEGYPPAIRIFLEMLYTCTLYFASDKQVLLCEIIVCAHQVHAHSSSITEATAY